MGMWTIGIVKPPLPRSARQQELQPPSDGPAEVKVSPWVAVFLAVIGIVPPLATAGLDWLLKPSAQKSTEALEVARLKFEQRKASADLLRSALAIPDESQRRAVVDLLYNQKLIDDMTTKLPEKLPYWPVQTEETALIDAVTTKLPESLPDLPVQTEEAAKKPQR